MTKECLLTQYYCFQSIESSGGVEKHAEPQDEEEAVVQDMESLNQSELENWNESEGCYEYEASEELEVTVSEEDDDVLSMSEEGREELSDDIDEMETEQLTLHREKDSEEEEKGQELPGDSEEEELEAEKDVPKNPGSDTLVPDSPQQEGLEDKEKQTGEGMLEEPASVSALPDNLHREGPEKSDKITEKEEIAPSNSQLEGAGNTENASEREVSEKLEKPGYPDNSLLKASENNGEDTEGSVLAQLDTVPPEEANDNGKDTGKNVEKLNSNFTPPEDLHQPLQPANAEEEEKEPNAETTTAEGGGGVDTKEQACVVEKDTGMATTLCPNSPLVETQSPKSQSPEEPLPGSQSPEVPSPGALSPGSQSPEAPSPGALSTEAPSPGALSPESQSPDDVLDKYDLTTNDAVSQETPPPVFLCGQYLSSVTSDSEDILVVNKSQTMAVSGADQDVAVVETEPTTDKKIVKNIEG